MQPVTEMRNEKFASHENVWRKVRSLKKCALGIRSFDGGAGSEKNFEGFYRSLCKIHQDLGKLKPDVNMEM